MVQSLTTAIIFKLCAFTIDTFDSMLVVQSKRYSHTMKILRANFTR